MSEEPKNFWGKLALLTAFLSALGGLAGLLSKCSEYKPSSQPVNSGQYAPQQQPATPYPVPPAASTYPTPTAQFCCDMYGYRRCQLITPAIVGSGCFCPGQGAGISCP